MVTWLIDWYAGVDWWAVAATLQRLALYYFIVMMAVFVLLNGLSLAAIRRHMEAAEARWLPKSFEPLQPPVSILVPAYNEALNVVGSVQSLLHLDYANLEVIVINDGSTDDTLARLVEAFELEAFPEVYSRVLDTRSVHSVYRSRRVSSLRVVDKENGGKADALKPGSIWPDRPWCAVWMPIPFCNATVFSA